MAIADTQPHDASRRPARPVQFRAVLLATERLAEHTFVMRLRGCEPLAAVEAGQFVMVRGEWGRDPLLPRAFSVLAAAVDGDPDVAEILVKTVGRGTLLLERAAPGAAFDLLGPLGHGFPLASPPDAICVAGGVGLAPLLLFAHQARAKFGAAARLELHYGARAAGDLVLLDRCERELAGRVHLATEDGSAGARGRVTELTRARLASLRSPAPTVLTCGPTPMMAAVAEIARSAGARCLASLEGPMACGIGVCLGCAVPARSRPFRYVCSEGPVLECEDIREWR